MQKPQNWKWEVGQIDALKKISLVRGMFYTHLLIQLSHQLIAILLVCPGLLHSASFAVLFLHIYNKTYISCIRVSGKTASATLAL